MITTKYRVYYAELKLPTLTLELGELKARDTEDAEKQVTERWAKTLHIHKGQNPTVRIFQLPDEEAFIQRAEMLDSFDDNYAL